MKKKKQISQGDQKMKEYHESLQQEAKRKMQEANPLIESEEEYYNKWSANYSSCRPQMFSTCTSGGVKFE
jgi:hypothetical protein